MRRAASCEYAGALKVRRGDWTFLSVAQRTLALRRQKDFTHSRVCTSGKDRNRSGNPAMTHAAPKTFFFTSESDRGEEDHRAISGWKAGQRGFAFAGFGAKANANWLPARRLLMSRICWKCQQLRRLRSRAFTRCSICSLLENI